MRDSKQLSAALLSLRRPDAPHTGKSPFSARRIACALLLLITAAYGIRAWLAHSATFARRGSFVPEVQAAMTNPVGFAKSHVTGGIGAVLLVDPATGLPRIQIVLAGSPAARAGLRPGDVILEVDGVTTRGRTLAQDVDHIRGIASISVGLLIQRAGSTNLNCLIHRTSWSGLGVNQ
ncbi:MAG TPA: PDZ domain-containing protein [Verrucomicrobiae bacterium]|nr:PDZ domain-containing protein [Verrucomicrobiae bacterium]